MSPLPGPPTTPPPPAPYVAGETPAIRSHIESAAKKAKLTPAAWLTKHFNAYFRLP